MDEQAPPQEPTEEEKQPYSPKNPRRRFRVDNSARTEEKPKTEKKVDEILWHWFPKDAENAKELRAHYRSIWFQMAAEAGEDGEDIYSWPVTSGGVRITMAFLENVYMEPTSIAMRDLLKKASVRLDDYFLWEKGKFGNYCKVLEKRVAKRQMRGYFKSVLHTLADMATNEKNQRASETLLRAMGYLNGEPDEREGLSLEVVKEYILEDEKISSTKEEVEAKPGNQERELPLSKARKLTRMKFKNQGLRTHDPKVVGTRGIADETVDTQPDPGPSV